MADSQEGAKRGQYEAVYRSMVLGFVEMGLLSLSGVLIWEMEKLEILCWQVDWTNPANSGAFEGSKWKNDARLTIGCKYFEFFEA